MNKNEWIDIARTGTFTAGNGKKTTFTSGDFDRLIENFYKNQCRIPLVFGHPKENAPAYGWVEALRRTKNILQAKFKQVHEDVKKLVRGGNFKNVSISISPDLSFLHHIGLLGAVQPAISGLREVSFADSADCLTFELNPEEIQEEIESLKEEIEQLREELEAQRKKEETESKEKRLKRIQDAVVQGKVNPGEFANLKPFIMALLEANSMLTFADRPEPVHAVDALAEIFEARPITPLFTNFSEFRKPQHIIDQEEALKLDQDNPAYII